MAQSLCGQQTIKPRWHRLSGQGNFSKAPNQVVHLFNIFFATFCSLSTRFKTNVFPQDGFTTWWRAVTRAHKTSSSRSFSQGQRSNSEVTDSTWKPLYPVVSLTRCLPTLRKLLKNLVFISVPTRNCTQLSRILHVFRDPNFVGDEYLTMFRTQGLSSRWMGCGTICSNFVSLLNAWRITAFLSDDTLHEMRFQVELLFSFGEKVVHEQFLQTHKHAGVFEGVFFYAWTANKKGTRTQVKNKGFDQFPFQPESHKISSLFTFLSLPLLPDSVCASCI